MNEDEIARAQAEYEQVRGDYEDFADALRVLVTQLLADERIEVEPISARAKEVPSLVDKLRRKSHYSGIDDIVDKCGLRIVTRYQSDVARVCNLLAHEFSIEESVDHGAGDIQSFGYASRHLIVRLHPQRKRLREWRRFGDLVAEIQVRSILQHAWASISHGLDYKTDADVPATMRRTLFRVAALLETGDELFDTFRTGVEQLKSGYQADVARNRWADLRLDHDSLLAAWNRLPLARLAETAIEAGWQPWSDEAADDPEFERSGNRVSRLITIASSLGIQTLGQLGQEIEKAIADRALLELIQQTGRTHGFHPYAIAPDVLGMVLMARDQRGQVQSVLVREEIPFHRDLMAALAEMAGTDAASEPA